jgi:hypothetical protein
MLKKGRFRAISAAGGSKAEAWGRRKGALRVAVGPKRDGAFGALTDSVVPTKKPGIGPGSGISGTIVRAAPGCAPRPDSAGRAGQR